MHSVPESAPAAVAPAFPPHDGAPPADAAPPPEWPLWQRIALRYLLIHYVLYTFPAPLSGLLRTITGVFGHLAGALEQPWLADRPFRWPGKWATELGKIDEGWQALTTWLDQHGLAPYELIHQRTGSGDTGHDVAKLMVIVLVAALGTALYGLWSVEKVFRLQTGFRLRQELPGFW